jgi:hypothetical protein
MLQKMRELKMNNNRYRILFFFIVIQVSILARNPFIWDERLQPIECGLALPHLEGVSIDPSGSRLANIRDNNETKVRAEGERIGNWKIKSIRYDSAILEGLDGKTCTISLHLE